MHLYCLYIVRWGWSAASWQMTDQPEARIRNLVQPFQLAVFLPRVPLVLGSPSPEPRRRVGPPWLTLPQDRRPHRPSLHITADSVAE
ncbi:hypothetical protein N657DRAFT_113487 [Parathielavia appendiculata]|uniref:Uncharacterized protein n=1 Tax=Parathielavia appendiculata TaxID=2587402 RepID=A0AAN6TW84_9PEZI|nr:hypothetical protein N657DRAFT_113487 [Parathielavia appendiculata]